MPLRQASLNYAGIDFHFLLLRLPACLPLLPQPLVGDEVGVHLVSGLSLPFQHLRPLLEAVVVEHLLGAVFSGVAEQPLEEDYVVLKHPFGHFVEACRLVYPQLFKGVFDLLQVTEVVLRVSCAVIQPNQRNAPRVQRIENMCVAHPIGQRLDRDILGLCDLVDPSQEISLANIGVHILNCIIINHAQYV